MRPRVAVSSASFCRSPALMAELATLPVEIHANPEGRDLDEGELRAFLVAAQATHVILGREPLTSAVLDACPSLRFVAKYGVGLDNLDPAELARRGIAWSAAQGVNRMAVAELTLAFILGHARNVVRAIDEARRGVWRKDGGRGLDGAVVGLVGFGHVGTAVAEALRPFGARVLFTDILDKSPEAAARGATYATYDELLAQAEIVSFHVPRTPRTRHMLDAAAITRMRRDALVVNTARGDVVDFGATCEAVIAGRLGGFAADVFPTEPCDLRPWTSPSERLYFTPHTGGNSAQAVAAMGGAAIAGLRDALA
jgi:D-3-phosphoglycerate dehydrogenase